MSREGAARRKGNDSFEARPAGTISAGALDHDACKEAGGLMSCRTGQGGKTDTARSGRRRAWGTPLRECG